jgi:hypothetical protein
MGNGGGKDERTGPGKHFTPVDNRPAVTGSPICLNDRR